MTVSWFILKSHSHCFSSDEECVSWIFGQRVWSLQKSCKWYTDMFFDVNTLSTGTACATDSRQNNILDIYLFEIPHLNYSGHKGEPFGNWACEKLHYNVHEQSLIHWQIWQRHEETISKILSVILAKRPPPHKQCPRVLYITDNPLIRNIGILIASPNQTLASDWFISNRRRKLFFGEEALSHGDRVG